MHSEIYRIAYQLSLQGKNPSVALIRARLSKPTSLPEIIQALQQWKLTPELGKEVKTSPADDSVIDDNEQDNQQSNEQQRLDNIEQRLMQLEDKVDQIMILLSNKSSQSQE